MNEATRLRALLQELVDAKAAHQKACANYKPPAGQSVFGSFPQPMLSYPPIDTAVLRLDKAWEAARKACLPPVDMSGPIVLGVDGNAGFAMIGPNLQEGEAEFVGIRDGMGALKERQIRACAMALATLRQRIGRPEAPFVYGPTHPSHKEPLDGPQEV